MCKIESYFGKLERIFGEIKENWECCKDEKIPTTETSPDMLDHTVLRE